MVAFLEMARSAAERGNPRRTRSTRADMLLQTRSGGGPTLDGK